MINKFYNKILLGLSHYVGIDIAKSSLIDFVSRIKDLPSTSQSKIHSLIEMDMGSLDISFTTSLFQTYLVQSQKWFQITPFPIYIDQKHLTFDIASCQFAVHYMFQTKQKAHYFFQQIHEQLSSNGIIVLTTIDSRIIAQLILNEASKQQQQQQQHGLKRYSLSGKLERNQNDLTNFQQNKKSRYSEVIKPVNSINLNMKQKSDSNLIQHFTFDNFIDFFSKLGIQFTSDGIDVNSSMKFKLLNNKEDNEQENDEDETINFQGFIESILQSLHDKECDEILTQESEEICYNFIQQIFYDVINAAMTECLGKKKII